MINFVVVDDEASVLKKVENTINETMMSNNIDYRIHSFLSFDKDFYSLANDTSKRKVYILDIQVNNDSGIDVARNLRDDDVESIIIFLTAFADLTGIVVEDTIMPLTYINKFDNSHDKLVNAINKALTISGKKKMIRFREKGSVFTIPTKDILYIARETVERKSVIVTDYNEFRSIKSLVELSEMLGEPFVESHRACLVNMDRVRIIDKRNRTITFDNGMTTNLVSPNFKVEVPKYARNI